MITTRNRCADLQRTLGVLAKMNPAADEVLITADGCVDDTVEMVRKLFPLCRLWVNDVSVGSIPSRDRMLREAVGDLVVSLDDDSYPLEGDFFARLAELFARHPEAGVVTFPELRDDGVYESAAKTPASAGHFVAAFANCAAAMRRETYLQTGGYPLFFSHAYEEPDFALQCYQHGSAVWFEPDLTIRHHLSARNRSGLRTHQLNARNELWSVWLRCPWPWLPVVSAFRVWRQFRYACTEGWSWVIREPLWWWRALCGAGKCLRQRRPAEWPLYLGWMRLARRRVETLPELRSLLGQS
ncbi:MAG TPA: glycosyltransferase [Prosthecobacter sp.]|nr:glycosyltransferase [Prosthecobacter sp.]